MIDAVLVEVPNPRHPFGAKGVGEVPIVPPLAAVANAVRDALGRADVRPAAVAAEDPRGDRRQGTRPGRDGPRGPRQLRTAASSPAARPSSTSPPTTVRRHDPGAGRTVPGLRRLRRAPHGHRHRRRDPPGRLGAELAPDSEVCLIPEDRGRIGAGKGGSTAAPPASARRSPSPAVRRCAPTGTLGLARRSGSCSRCCRWRPRRAPGPRGWRPCAAQLGRDVRLQDVVDPGRAAAEVGLGRIAHGEAGGLQQGAAAGGASAGRAAASRATDRPRVRLGAAAPGGSSASSASTSVMSRASAETLRRRLGIGRIVAQHVAVILDLLPQPEAVTTMASSPPASIIGRQASTLRRAKRQRRRPRGPCGGPGRRSSPRPATSTTSIAGAGQQPHGRLVDLAAPSPAARSPSAGHAAAPRAGRAGTVRPAPAPRRRAAAGASGQHGGQGLQRRPRRSSGASGRASRASAAPAGSAPGRGSTKASRPRSSRSASGAAVVWPRYRRGRGRPDACSCTPEGHVVMQERHDRQRSTCLTTSGPGAGGRSPACP